jgi:hypothetical protein
MVSALIMGSLGCAYAGTSTATYSGEFVPTWSNPVLSGVNIDGATGVSRIANDTTDAACNLSGCPVVLSGYGSSTLAWGNLPGYTGSYPTTSVLTFTPNSFSNASEGQRIDLGTFSYLNGSSEHIIYGATLTLSLAGITPFVLNVPIITTANTGTRSQNADWVGPISTTSGNVSFNVYEGMTATADLYGTILSDPYLQLTGLALDSGQSANGFIGNGEPVPVPEPASFLLLGVGLIGLSLTRLGRRSFL